MNPKISVIVPIYKAEEYLHRCINSILTQTFKDFELLLIDDGSPDGSGAICDEYAKKDSRIRVIHKENGGVTKARATGVENCISEYLTFVDADDYLPITALNDLVTEITKGIDIVIGGYTTSTGAIKCYKEQILNIYQYRRETLIRMFIHTGPYCKLFRKHLFNEFTFDIPRDIYMGEDLLMNIRLAFSAQKDIKIIDKSVYFYYIDNPTNCTTNFKRDFNYEYYYYYYYKESIPHTQYTKYLAETITFRLSNIMEIHQHYITCNIWHILPFHKQLLKDIKENNQQIKFSIKIALSCHNPLSCYFYKKLIYFKTFIKKIINKQ